MIDLAQFRKSAKKRAAARPKVSFDGRVMESSIGHVPIRRYAPRLTRGNTLAIFCHGGYGIFGNLDLQDSYCRLMATAWGCRVWAVDYRLAPECTFMDALNDLRLCMSEAPANDGLLLCGDSAGGALCVAAAATPEPSAQGVFLTNPNLDLSLASFNRAALGGPDWPITVAALTEWVKPAQISNAPRLHLLGRNLPPVFVAVGSRDSLLTEARALVYHEAAHDDRHELLVLDGLSHGFMSDAKVASRVFACAQPFLSLHRSTP